MADKIVVMEHGHIRQTGPPLDLYDRPQNLFVAGFIGSPAMNLLPGRVEAGAFVAEDGARWPVPPGAWRDTAAIYGIRPEHFRLDPDGMAARVQLVEPMGSETLVMFRVGDQPLQGVFRERISPRPGETLPVSPDPALAHLFDREGGQRLSPT